jgi:ribonuclease BN (tRNA processing enzyme)
VDVRLLGSGGWIPTDRRETSCLYARDGADVLLIDAGSGVRRLVSEPSLLEGVERLNIVLTHFHLDHTIGLLYVPALKDVPQRVIWGPGRIAAEMSTEDLVHRLLDPPLLAGHPEEVFGDIFTGVRDFGAGPLRVGPFELEARVQPLHTTPSMAVKLDGWLAYCTDTSYDEDNAVFADGASILLHEAFWAADEGDAMHTAAGEAARIAAAADVDQLVLVHVHPRLVDDGELVRFARPRFAASEVGRDGLVLST